jgi:hypothetical protein
MLRVAAVALALALVALAVAWPRINDVETGRTPEYPELTPRRYPQSEPAVTQATRTAIERLPRWSVSGTGKGPGGSEVQAVAGTPIGLKHDVTVRIRREASGSRVEVRSRSRNGPWDFGQNARNIHVLLDQLELELKKVR